MKEVVLLLNPAAGRGRSIKKKKEIEKVFKSYKINYDLFVSQSEENLRTITRKVIPEYQNIVCIGGDTTFNIIATEILEKKNRIEDCPNLGLIGTGSANDLCHSLGVKDIKGLCELIINARVKKMDVGYVWLKREKKGLFFFGSMSVGLGTAVNRYIEEFTHKHKFLSRNLFLAQRIGGGMGVYSSFSKQLVPRTVSLGFNNEIKNLRFSLLVFLNTNYYAGGMNLSPDTNVFNGQIDCVAIETSSFFETLKFQHSVKRGKHRKRKEFRLIRSSRFFMASEAKIDIQLDGEIIKDINECEVSVKPQALNVFAK